MRQQVHSRGSRGEAGWGSRFRVRVQGVQGVRQGGAADPGSGFRGATSVSVNDPPWAAQPQWRVYIQHPPGDPCCSLSRLAQNRTLCPKF